MKPELRRRAFREAAAILAADMDSADLSADLTEKEENVIREYIRIEIVAMLERHGEPRRGSFGWLKKRRFGEGG